MSIENIKELSPELTELLEKLKSNILNTRKIFDQFVTLAREEEFSDEDIDTLVAHHLKGIIPKTSLRRLRQEYLSLPEPKKGPMDQIDDKKVIEDSSIIEDGIIIPDENEKRDPNKIEIKTAYDILEGESEPEQQNKKEQFVPDPVLEEFRNKGKQTQEQQYINKSELETLRQQLQEGREKIEYLQKEREKLELEKEKLEIALNKVYSGSDIFEVKDKQIPLKWQFVILPKEKMVFDLDIPRARKMGIWF